MREEVFARVQPDGDLQHDRYFLSWASRSAELPRETQQTIVSALLLYEWKAAERGFRGEPDHEPIPAAGAGYRENEKLQPGEGPRCKCYAAFSSAAANQ